MCEVGCGAGAGLGAVWSNVPMLVVSVVLLLGFERTRQLLVKNARQLERLSERTRALAKETRLVVEGYRGVTRSMSRDMLRVYAQRRSALRLSLEQLAKDAGGSA